jgi:hypothetical protein
MAKEPRRGQPADALKIDIARSRDEVAREFRGLRYELDIPRKIRRSFREQTGLWIGAAVVVGTLIVLVPLRKKKVYVDLANGKKQKPAQKFLEAGFLLGVLRIAVTMLKPTITNFVMKKIRGPGAPRPRSTKW